MSLPPLVSRARALARELGFERSCSDAAGRLLSILAAQRGRVRVGEIGTGCGVGSGWILSGLAPTVPFVTVERDERLADAARALLAADRHVTVLTADWRDVMSREAPFDLLFVDARDAKADPEVVGLLAPGGTALVDDLKPGRAGGDPVRELWLGRDELLAAEVVVGPSEAAIVAVRVI